MIKRVVSFESAQPSLELATSLNLHEAASSALMITQHHQTTAIEFFSL